MEKPILVILAVLSIGAAYAWARSARLRLRLLGRLEASLRELDQRDSVAQRAAITITRGDFRRDSHASILYALVAFSAIVVVGTDNPAWVGLFGVLALPATVSLMWSRNSVKEARLSADRFDLERRAEEALNQQNLAPGPGRAGWRPTSCPTSGASRSGASIRLDRA